MNARGSLDRDDNDHVSYWHRLPQRRPRCVKIVQPLTLANKILDHITSLAIEHANLGSGERRSGGCSEVKVRLLGAGDSWFDDVAVAVGNVVRRSASGTQGRATAAACIGRTGIAKGKRVAAA